MKKNYLFTLAVMFLTICTANAQFSDDFESYPLGTYHGGNWSSWNGNAGAEDIIVTSAFAADGTKSGFIGGSTVQDALLVLGNKTTGSYGLSFQAYIPTGKSAYFNFQGTLTANGGANAGEGIFNSPNLIFNNVLSTSGTPGTGGAYGNVDDDAAIYTWSYPEGEWFPIEIIFDVDAALWTMTIDGNTLAPQLFDAENVLGGIDFYSFDANNEMYIDSIVYSETLSVGDESLSFFKAYPNPVEDMLQLQTQSRVDLVEIYDVLGKKMVSTIPGTVSPKLDMTNIPNGAYIVKIVMGDQSKSIKIIK